MNEHHENEQLNNLQGVRVELIKQKNNLYKVLRRSLPKNIHRAHT